MLSRIFTIKNLFPPPLKSRVPKQCPSLLPSGAACIYPLNPYTIARLFIISPGSCPPKYPLPPKNSQFFDKLSEAKNSITNLCVRTHQLVHRIRVLWYALTLNHLEYFRWAYNCQQAWFPHNIIRERINCSDCNQRTLIFPDIFVEDSVLNNPRNTASNGATMMQRTFLAKGEAKTLVK